MVTLKFSECENLLGVIFTIYVNKCFPRKLGGLGIENLVVFLHGASGGGNPTVPEVES